MQITQTVAPTAEPVTVTEAHQQLRLETDEDDVLLPGYITAAREHAEAHTHRQLMLATWRYDLVRFPVEIVLPNPPLSSITSVKYYDTAGDLQTLTASKYQNSASEPVRIATAYGESWPTTRSGIYDAVQVTYVAGYASAAAVPRGIKIGMLQLIAHWYENRESVVTGITAMQLPQTVESLWHKHIATWNQP